MEHRKNHHQPSKAMAFNYAIFFKIALFACALIACLIFSYKVHAQSAPHQTLILSNAYSEHFLSPYMSLHRDKAGEKTLRDIILSNEAEKEFPNFSGSIACLGSHNKAIWIMFNVINRSDNQDWVLDFGDGFGGRFGLLEKIDIYRYDLESKNFTKEKYVKGNNTVTFSLAKDQKTKIFIKTMMEGGIPITLPLRLVQKDNFNTIMDQRVLFITAVLLIGMGFFFGAIALIKSNYSYLYFSLYYTLLTILLYVQNYYVVGDIALLGSSVIPFLFLLISLSGFMIGRIFWDMDNSSRFANILFYSFIGLNVALFLTGLFSPASLFDIKSILLFGPCFATITFIPIISIIQSKYGHEETTPFMFGWFILLFGLSITALALNDLMPPVSAAINAYWYTLIPQAIFFIISVKMKFAHDTDDVHMSKTVNIDETQSVQRLRQSKENTEQERLLKVIEQERRVLGELRQSEARRTEEMRTAKEEADVANSAKSAFLAVVSHEIRTPMTGIMGMVRLLQESSLTKEQKDYTQTIQDSSDAMLALLNDILDFEKIEQGKMNFENIDFDLHRLIQGVATLMNGHATQKNIELKTKIGNGLPRHIKGDPTRLRQVLLNLTGNAVKFTEKGHVTITAELMKDHHSQNEYEIYFSITDSGIGISKEAQVSLFAPFSQADSSISRKFGGTGLGLAISKGLIAAMGSQININSNEGEGSTFFFTLNMPKGSKTTTDNSEDKNTGTISPKDMKPLKLLIVDDNEINQKVIKGFLEKLPYTLLFSDHAEIAIEMIEKQNFDLVLMDIQLPGLKGDEATKKIREKGNKTPVIALTGNTMPQDVEKYYTSGMNGYIAKPIDPDELKQKIENAGKGILDQSDMKLSDTAETPKTEKKKLVISGGEITINQAPKPAQKNKINNEGNIVFKSETLDTLKGHISQKDIQEMIDDVIQKNDEIINDLNEALSKEDRETISTKGHELKGMAGNFGLLEISDCGGALEEKAQTQPSIVLSALINDLPEMQKRAKKALYTWLDSFDD